MIPKNGNHIVMVQHGNYFTIYKNLSKIYVKKGHKVKTKQFIGEVLTNRASGETILSFVIFKDGKTQNPAANESGDALRLEETRRTHWAHGRSVCEAALSRYGDARRNVVAEFSR